MRHSFPLLLTAILAGALLSCGSHEKQAEEKTSFTKSDSLTDSYLNLQDSLLWAWNAIEKDENEKLEAMDAVLEYLGKIPEDQDRIPGLMHRLDQLRNIRINQTNLSNPYVVDEYDFASNSLINEIISLTESDPSFIQNKKLQSWIDEIKSADQRVPLNRTVYDSIANQFNIFLEKNKGMLTGLDSANEKKPLFKID